MRRGWARLPSARVRAKYLKRMWDLSEFMKTLKQKFTSWFNRLRARAGTLWESRFASVLVEGSYRCLLKVAAYIDLNPSAQAWRRIRRTTAGVATQKRCRAIGRPGRGLVLALENERPGTTWRELGQRYREVFLGSGKRGLRGRAQSVPLALTRWHGRFPPASKLTLVELLRCRVRYFSCGSGDRHGNLHRSVLQLEAAEFRRPRRSGARRLKGGGWGRAPLCP